MAKRKKAARSRARKRASPARKTSSMSMSSGKGMTCEPGSKSKCCAWVVLVLGALLLLRDLGYWEFWNISAWTLVFLVVGLWKVSCAMCNK